MKVPTLRRGKGSSILTADRNCNLYTHPLKRKANSPFTQGKEAFIFWNLYRSKSEIDFINQKIKLMTTDDRIIFFAGYFSQKNVDEVTQ